MLTRGVDVRCYALDPDSEKGRAYVADRSEHDYPNRARQALAELAKIREESMTRKPAGHMEIYLYDHVPMAHVLGIDLGMDAPSAEGQMMVSPYLFGLPRAEMPVIRFSAQSNATLYSRWWAALRALTAGARPFDG